VVDDGPYRSTVTATEQGVSSTRWALFTKAANVIYPARSKAIVVAVDPGHGDVYSEGGRVTKDGSREAVMNLDIGLRLRAMLEGAGVRTVITRTLDQGANTPAWDRTGDGLVDYADELESRCDTANAARADVFVAIHNNFDFAHPNVGGPSTYYWPERPYSAASYSLAKLVQANMLARLDLYRTASWYPSRSHGVLTHGYYVLYQYNPPHSPRPTFMPAVFRGHVHDQPVRALTCSSCGCDSRWRRRITTRSGRSSRNATARPATAFHRSCQRHERSQCWLRAVCGHQGHADRRRLAPRGTPPAVLLPTEAQIPASCLAAEVPTLAPGERGTVTMSLKAPPAGTGWSFDAVRSDGSHLSDLGSPLLQLPLSVGAAP
jgi:N-acetylmuramoyl-L-alanine amidase